MTETNDEIMVHFLHDRSAFSEVRELKLSLGALENGCVSMSNQLDRIDSRIERIRRRLDPTDA
jgi:hypothetical protein